MERLDHLKLGRELYRRRAWADAYNSLARADRAVRLGVEDLELLAMSAYLIGREEDYARALDRAHHAFVDAGECARGARCAFWIGLSHFFQGEAGPASGWFGRAQRLLDREARDCVEQGYLLLPLAEQHLSKTDSQAAHTIAARAVEIGERFGESDLIACARHLEGRALMQRGKVEPGLALLDEAMVAVVADDLSPRMTGLIYCSVIDNCLQVYAYARAREWSSALARWCAVQPQLVSFTDACLVHRAEVMRLHGAWPDAIEEGRRACAGATQRTPAAAFYQQGEMHRLRGEYKIAERAYREASRRGFEPQPGLALLRMAQGRGADAAGAIRRITTSTRDKLRRTRLLPACVEIMQAVGDIEEARRACRELDAIAGTYDIPVLRAIAAHARGSVDLADGDAGTAFDSLHYAFGIWQKVGAPYEVARVRELMGLACRALGDDDGAGLELEAARIVFQQLGAMPDLARVNSLVPSMPAAQLHGLTSRELQVLRMVAAGKTNRAIATELYLSQRTIDRHVSNLMRKLDVASRTAATAYAHEHDLV